MSVRQFEPTRLTLARQLRRLSKLQLAQDIGVSNQSITHWEQGAHEPHPEHVTALVFRLRLPPTFFQGERIDIIPPDLPSFRARRTMTAGVRDGALADGTVATQIISRDVNRRFKLPECGLPRLDIDDDGIDPVTAATAVRKLWGLAGAPIKNMIQLVESKGVEVYWIQRDSEKVDAFSLWLDGRPFIFLNASCAAGERQRFSVAHELGHLVMHRSFMASGSIAKKWKEIESEANAFASALLLPKREFEAECPKYPVLSRFLPLKARWGVSVQAMIVWCNRNKIFDDDTYESLYHEISRRRWRSQEPDSLPTEKSKLHTIILSRLFEQGVTPSIWASELNVTTDDIASVVPAVSDFITTVEQDPDVPDNARPFRATQSTYLQRVK